MPTSNFPDGVTNVSTGPLASLIELDPTLVHQYFDDFNSYTAGQWVVTVVGTGTAALLAGNNGLLQLLNSAANNDAVHLQRTPAAFAFTPGKRAWFKARLQLSDVVNSGFIVGLAIVDTTPFDATDGVYFYKATGSAVISAFVRKDATTGSTTATLGSLTNATNVDLGFYYDGQSSVQFFVNDAAVANLSGASTYLPDATNLTVTLGVVNGAAAAKSATVDYIFAAIER